ncbi:MAG: LysR family transcriptional regulator [Lachnospiraceae bacterium]|nr:LysR family transcriptional regulator [Lachnospiraceae bacterium]
MNSKQIESFLCVADCLNISTAAQILFSAPSTISRQINQLEEELGLSLFFRGNNYLRLTASGAAMTKTFKLMQRSLNKGYSEAKQINDGFEGSIKIGLYSFMQLSPKLLSKLQSFSDKYPNIKISYECYPTGLLESVMRKNDCDIIFIHSFDRIENSIFKYEHVYFSRQFLIYGKCHPLAAKNDLSLLDFKNELFWFVQSRDNALFKEMIDSIFKHYAISEYNSIKAQNFDTVLFNVSMGKGVCFIDQVTAPINPDSFCMLEIADSISEIGIDIAWNCSNTNSAMYLLLDYIKK